MRGVDEDAGGFGFADGAPEPVEATKTETSIKGFVCEAGELADGGDFAVHVTRDAAVEMCNENEEAMVGACAPRESSHLSGTFPIPRAFPAHLAHIISARLCVSGRASRLARAAKAPRATLPTRTRGRMRGTR